MCIIVTYFYRYLLPYRRSRDRDIGASAHNDVSWPMNGVALRAVDSIIVVVGCVIYHDGKITRDHMRLRKIRRSKLSKKNTRKL